MSESNLDSLKWIFESEISGIRIENQLLLLIIDAIIVCFVGFLISRKRKVPVKTLIHAYLFLVYMGILFSITVFRRPVGSREGIIHPYIRLGFGIVSGRPSLQISAYSIFNILLFIPFGILTCLTLNNKRKLQSIIITAVVGFFMSLTVECIQLITGRGMFELTDLVTNTAGSFIGALLYEGFTRKQISVS